MKSWTFYHKHSIVEAWSFNPLLKRFFTEQSVFYGRSVETFNKLASEKHHSSGVLVAIEMVKKYVLQTAPVKGNLCMYHVSKQVASNNKDDVCQDVIGS